MVARGELTVKKEFSCELEPCFEGTEGQVEEVAAPANGQAGILPGNFGSLCVLALVQVWELLTVAHGAN